MTGRCIIDFDHHSADFAANREAILEELRTTSPMAGTETHGGYWFVTSYPLICEILRNDDGFVVERAADGSGGITIPDNKDKAPLLPGELDGELHDTYRHALNPFFSKKQVETLRPFIEGVVEELTNHLLEIGQFDGVTDFAQQVPARAVLTYAGIQVEDTWDLYEAVALSREQPTADEVQAVIARLKAIIADKRRDGTDDLLGHLIQFTDPTFSDDDLVGLMVGLILGGVRSTADTLGHVLYHLDIDRELRARLIANTEAIPASVEELLRVYTPILGLARTAVKDAVVGGQEIHAGDRVLLAYHAANRDEVKFANAQEFDPDRPLVPHMTFGRGVHFCLGSWLARLELRVAVEVLLRKIPNYSIDRDNCTFIDRVGLRNAWTSLPASTNA